MPPAIESALRRDPPTAYVAITSAPEDLVRRAVREVAESGVEVVVASPAHDLSDLAGPRVAVGGLLPSHRIMPRVTLAVTAGGQGSLQCAMAAGTPVIGIPLQPEQEANLAWLERAGAAQRLPAADVGRGILPGLMGRMIAEPSHKAAAMAISAHYARRNGPALSAEAILRFLADRRGLAGRSRAGAP